MARFDRRDFLRSAALASAGTLALRPAGSAPDLPGAPDARPRVVHVHHGRAARWPRVSGRYRDHVDQAAVTLALDEAVRVLKQGSSARTAWEAVFPLDRPETRRLSIKINNNNSTDPIDGAGDDIDAIPEPVIAVIAGFVKAGGLPANVNVYDATNTSPARFIGEWFRAKVSAAFPGTQFNAWSGGGGACTASTCVAWDAAYTSRPPDMRLAAAVLQTDYVVNVPIVKRHGQANVTLGYKAHMGSVDRCDRLHPWLFADVAEASVLADIMGSPYVPGDPSVTPLYRKTVLTVGDMLLGQPCRNFDAPPRPWKTWDNEWPNSLIVSDDVVAAESVMFDLLTAEPATDGGCGSVATWARRYMQIAEAKGQGVHDVVLLPSGVRFDPARMTYTKIDYRYLDLMSSGALLNASKITGGRVLLQWQHYFPGACEVQRSTQPNFSNPTVLGSSPAGQWVDNNPPPRAFYRVRFKG